MEQYPRPILTIQRQEYRQELLLVMSVQEYNMNSIDVIFLH